MIPSFKNNSNTFFQIVSIDIAILYNLFIDNYVLGDAKVGENRIKNHIRSFFGNIYSRTILRFCIRQQYELF